MSPYLYCGGNPINITDPDGRYLFGLFGSTSEQRRAARDFAADHHGFVVDRHKKSIHVDYTTSGGSQVNPETGQSGPVINSNKQYFRKNGLAETGSEVANAMHDVDQSLLESGNSRRDFSTGNLIQNPSSGQIDYSPVNIEDIIGGVALGKALLSNSLENSVKLAIRDDIILNGGRSGQFVKDLEGPANSVLKGNGNRIFISNDAGQVIWDVTKNRAKPVIPGQGFGPKVAPSTEQLELLEKIWGR